MVNVKEFLATRRKELESKISELRPQVSKLQSELRALQSELSEVEIASNAIGRSSSGGGPSLFERVAGGPPIRKGTLKDKIIAVLKLRPKGATSTEILDLIAEQFDETIPRTSLSPQLSRLKSEGWLSLIGSNWILTDHQNDETEDAPTSSVSNEDQEYLGRTSGDTPASAGGGSPQ